MPRGRFVVVTGVSGSGKSTLAFDLLFAEGQRRFLDSMNVYARQFVEQLSRPDVDLITGIPPTVSIEQRTSRGGGKSTVATVTEVHHFIRLLFARLGTQFCPDCQVPVEAQTRDELGRRLRRRTAPARRPAVAGAGGEEPQGLPHRCRRMGRQPRLRRGPGGWEVLSHQRAPAPGPVSRARCGDRRGGAGCQSDVAAKREGERPREPKHSRGDRARGDARPPRRGAAAH